MKLIKLETIEYDERDESCLSPLIKIYESYKSLKNTRSLAFCLCSMIILWFESITHVDIENITWQLWGVTYIMYTKVAE